MARYEVQTYTVCDGWINCWTDTKDEEEVPATFETHDLAQAAIYEFFADLARGGMAQMYDMDQYRVQPVAKGAGNE